MRVFELAKQMGMTSKKLQEELVKLGIKVKNHMSALDEADVRAITQKLKAEPTPPKAPTKKSAKAATPAAEKRAAGKAAPSAAAGVAKRSHLLIKKRVPSEEEVVPEAGVEPQPATMVHPVKEGKEMEGAGVSAAGTSERAADTVKAPSTQVPSTPLSGEPQEKTEARPTEGAKGEEKRKTEAPLEVWKLEKKDTRVKFPEGPKKAKKPKGSQPGEVFDFRKELTKLHEFRPFHRRDERARGATKKAQAGGVAEITKPRKKEVRLSPGLTVKEFAELIGQRPAAIISKFMEKGIMCTMNQPIDLQTAAQVAEHFNVPTEVVLEKTEEELIPVVEDTPASLLVRSPVVTIMGHVDHGKTSLLDAIRQTRVTDTEAGGITQHIGAYMVKVGAKHVTFLDTPGHEAFTAMRARGAQVTDIVILVVAADDGVMPQTLEAINHAKAANVPIIVAINKIDKPEANADRVRNALSEQGLIPEAWGGQTIFVEVSAKKKLGLELLLEMILLQAEVLELKVNKDKPARGIIIEAELDRGRGPVATVLVQEGTLRVGDPFVTGHYSGKARALINDIGHRIEVAGPSMPVEVIGLEGVPQAGDSFIVAKDERLAKEIANSRQQRQRLIEIAQHQKVTLEDIYKRIQEGSVKELNLILKADVQGSIEALRDSLEKLQTEAVKVKIIHTAVGGITESDVLLAAASNAIIMGFNVRPEPKGQSLAEREEVDIRLYTVIYDATADVRAAMEGLLEPTLKEKVLGRAEVRKVFSIPKVGAVAGCYVSDGSVSRSSAGARVIRDNIVVYEGKLGSLKRFKDDVREVQTGFECGISIENFNDIKPGDIIEVYAVEKIAAKL